jgi:hypothetical protein
MDTSTDQILEARASRYGKYCDNAGLSQRLQAVIFESRSRDETPHIITEAIQMICAKLARAMNGDPTYIDNWADIAGYATLVVAELEGRGK